jgi:hypothetical protein
MTKLFGKANGQYKEKPGYAALHYRVYSAKGPAKVCKKCGSKSNVHWAQVGSIQKYVPLCRSCHASYDKAYKNLHR